MFVATYFEDKLKTSGSCSEYQNPNSVNHRKVAKEIFDGEKINCNEINSPEKTLELYQMNVRNNNNNNNNLETNIRMDELHECKKQPKIIGKLHVLFTNHCRKSLQLSQVI